MFNYPALDLAFYLFASQFLLGPLAVRFTNSQAAHPSLVPVPPQQLPPDIRQALQGPEASIRGLGFNLVGYIHLQASKPGVDTYFAYLIHPSTRVRAIVARMATATKKIGYLGFCTVFSDGSEINTINASTPGAFKSDPERPSYRFPSVQDPQKLMQIHTRLVQENAALKTAVLPPAGQEIAAFAQNWNRQFQRQVQFGYFYLDSAADRYRPTLLGAIIMTWKLAWPVGMIRKWIAQSRGESQMRRWGYV